MCDDRHQCTCGSGLRKSPQYDARGIFMCYTCGDCHQRKMATYRPEVRRNPNYHADEAIEED